jgi:hypothetical protein
MKEDTNFVGFIILVVVITMSLIIPIGVMEHAKARKAIDLQR